MQQDIDEKNMASLRLLGPSVTNLLSKHNLLSLASTINATGPKGNLIKSDVLAYLSSFPSKQMKFYNKRLNIDPLITYSMHSGKPMSVILAQTARKISMQLLNSTQIEIAKPLDGNIFGSNAPFSFYDYSKSGIEPEVYSLGRAKGILAVSRSGEAARVVGYGWFGERIEEGSELVFDLVVDEDLSAGVRGLGV